MADPNRKADIVAAARRVFAAVGYDKASIKKIAQEANLKSTALIYWYFENKEALLAEVLKMGAPLAQLDGIAEVLFMQPPEVVLPQLLQMHIGLLQQDDIEKVARIVLPEALRNETLQTELTNTINPVFGLIQGYLERQIKNGRFRPHDTAVSTRSLLAITVFYALNAMMLPEIGGGLPEQDHYIQEAVQIFIRGLSNP